MPLTFSRISVRHAGENFEQYARRVGSRAQASAPARGAMPATGAVARGGAVACLRSRACRDWRHRKTCLSGARAAAEGVQSGSLSGPASQARPANRSARPTARPADHSTRPTAPARGVGPGHANRPAWPTALPGRPLRPAGRSARPAAPPDNGQSRPVNSGRRLARNASTAPR